MSDYNHKRLGPIIAGSRADKNFPGNFPDPVHIPTGHELVKRYDPIRWSDMGGWSWDTGSIRECADGEYVRLEDVKTHLAGWLRDEMAKLEQDPRRRDEHDEAAERTIKAVIHHVETIL